MSYVPGFRNDVFLSYASEDNYEGAVEEFAKALEKHVSDNLVNPASSQEKIRIYFDRKRLSTQTAVNWEKHLEEEASSSALLVPLLSPNYLSSGYCTKELEWFGEQSHVRDQCPFAVVVWRPVDENLNPFEKAQSHAIDSGLAELKPPERRKSAKEFADKLSRRLKEMRRFASPVFLGPAPGLGRITRSLLRDELERSGHRVVPEAEFLFRNSEAVRAHLTESLLAIHFLEPGLDIEARDAIGESFLSAPKTVIVRPKVCVLGKEEERFLGNIESRLQADTSFAFTKLEHKTDDQVWQAVKWEVSAARFLKSRSRLDVGVACLASDFSGARSVAALIAQQGLPVRCPPYDSLPDDTDGLKALRELFDKSRALICYLAEAEAKGLALRHDRYARRKYEAKAWYLAPPLVPPAGATLGRPGEMVLHQIAPEADLTTLEPFLRELGWRPPTE
jgi:hypothetical protein